MWIYTTHRVLARILRDERGAAVAEYILIIVIACGCMAALALMLGGRASEVIYGAAQTISEVAVSIASGR